MQAYNIKYYFTTIVIGSLAICNYFPSFIGEELQGKYSNYREATPLLSELMAFFYTEELKQKYWYINFTINTEITGYFCGFSVMLGKLQEKSEQNLNSALVEDMWSKKIWTSQGWYILNTWINPISSVSLKQRSNKIGHKHSDCDHIETYQMYIHFNTTYWKCLGWIWNKQTKKKTQVRV